MKPARRGLLFAAWLAAGTCALPLAARASEPETVAWSQDWPRFRSVEGFATVLLALHAASVEAFYGLPAANVRDEILFDGWARDRLVLASRGSREDVGLIAAGLDYALLAYPTFVDVVLVTDLGHRATNVSGQLLAMNLEAYAFTAAVALSLQQIGRVRPADRGCRANARYHEDCGDPELNTSFPSARTALAFTSAGLTCVHHRHLPLYGGGAADLSACLGAIGVASAAGVMRVMSDESYASDVLFGAGLGLLSGYGLPALLHYGLDGRGDRESAGLLPVFHGRAFGGDVTAGLLPILDPQRLGVTLLGSY